MTVAWCRAGKGPYILEMQTYRYRGHSMSDPAKYRSKEEVQKMREEHDPIEQVRARLLKSNQASEDELKQIVAAPNGMKITIRHSKTDQEGAGQTIAIPFGKIACPVAALQEWITAADIGSGALFRSVNRHGKVGERLQARAEELSSVRELRIVGEDTDLTAVVDGRTWRAAYGRQNVPDGEVYTSPVETGVNGTIRFGFPAVFGGREIDDARLVLENGRVIAAEAAGGEEYLRSLLEIDEGANAVGEIAFGLNYEIDRFTRNILFDEKIGGTMHLALGMGFEALGGQNRSALHLDLICDLRREGEVYADGELVWRHGQFLQDPQPARLAERVR